MRYPRSTCLMHSVASYLPDLRTTLVGYRLVRGTPPGTHSWCNSGCEDGASPRGEGAGGWGDPN
jgi:hypothetical protein